MSPDEIFLEKLLLALDGAGLEALVVGATAAALQGAPVTTRDVDLLVRDTPENRQKIVRLSELLQAAKPAPVEDSSSLTILGSDVPVDLIFDTLPGGFTWDSIESRAEEIAIGSGSALVASLPDLIESKLASGQPRDLAQLPILRDTLRVKQALAGER